MYVKLFVMMGISWNKSIICVIILWFINGSNSIPIMIWYINYSLDILQGSSIFIMYVCKRKILRLLLKRFGWQDNCCFGTF